MTPDEIEFLRRTGALDKIKESTDDEIRHDKTSRPEIPKKTMIVVAVLFVLLTIAFASSMQSLQPYASMAEDKSLMAYLSMTAGDSGSNSSGSDMASQALAASNVYGVRSIVIGSIIAVGVIIEGVLIGQWWFRLRRWENNHEG